MHQRQAVVVDDNDGDADDHGPESLYEIMDVAETATREELKQAYHELALLLHPDKGGDEARFHEMERAYKLLEDPGKRAAYDEELRKTRERAELVEGAPTKSSSAAPVRVKTAPTPGSKRSQIRHALGIKRLGATHVLKAIEDGATLEEKGEAIYNRYKDLPKGKERRRDWLKNLTFSEKQAVKAAASRAHDRQAEKTANWLEGKTKTHENEVKNRQLHQRVGPPCRGNRKPQEVSRGQRRREQQKAKAALAAAEAETAAGAPAGVDPIASSSLRPASQAELERGGSPADAEQAAQDCVDPADVPLPDSDSDLQELLEEGDAGDEGDEGDHKGDQE